MTAIGNRDAIAFPIVDPHACPGCSFHRIADPLSGCDLSYRSQSNTIRIISARADPASVFHLTSVEGCECETEDRCIICPT